MTLPVSVIIMTRNEELRLDDCLRSLTDFDDVFVIDSSSQDKTIDIARTYSNVTTVDFTWDGQYPKKKQWCLSHLPFKHDWILYVDADERLTLALVNELRSLKPDDCSACFIKAKPVFLNRVLHFGQSNNKIALVKKNYAAFPQLDDLDMGEVEGTYQPQITGRTGQLRHAMLHDCNDFSAWLERHLRYARRDSKLMQRKRGLTQSVAYESRARRFKKQLLSHLPLRFLFVFFYGYIARLGFLDGRAGFHYAAARAFFYWQRDLLLSSNDDVII